MRSPVDFVTSLDDLKLFSETFALDGTQVRLTPGAIATLPPPPFQRLRRVTPPPEFLRLRRLREEDTR